MQAYGYANYRMIVGEQLGNEEETVAEYSVEEAMERHFRMPNCVILKRITVRERSFGIPEEQFELLDGRANMITKMPVRLLSLSLLDLRNRSVMWDVGFVLVLFPLRRSCNFLISILLLLRKERRGGN